MTDRRTIFMVVISMALIAVASIIASCWLISGGKSAADLLPLAGVAVGSLASMLAHTASAPVPPDPVPPAPPDVVGPAPHEGAV